MLISEVSTHRDLINGARAKRVDLHGVGEPSLIAVLMIVTHESNATISLETMPLKFLERKRRKMRWRK